MGEREIEERSDEIPLCGMGRVGDEETKIFNVTLCKTLCRAVGKPLAADGNSVVKFLKQYNFLIYEHIFKRKRTDN